jgi:hypothetical protein
MKQMITISAGVFLGISMTMLLFITDQLQDKLATDNYNKTHPVTKQIDIKGLDELIHGELLISGVSMALFVGLTVRANKVEK